MKRTLLILTFSLIIGRLCAQSKQQQLTLIIAIDRHIDQDIVNGKFIIKGKDHQPIDEMPFREWVGKLEMTNENYKKLFTFKQEDSLYVTFQNNNFELDTNYVYEGKIPKRLVNPQYLILNFYNKKNKESRKKYVFTGTDDYIIEVLSPGYGTIMKTNNSE